MMFGMLILGWNKAQRLCSTRVKTKLMLLSYFFLDRCLKFGEKWIFSSFYSIFKRFLHNIMIFKLICRYLSHYTLYSTKYSEKWNINNKSTLVHHLVSIWSTSVDFKEISLERQFNVDYAMRYNISLILSQENFHEMIPI